MGMSRRQVIRKATAIAAAGAPATRAVTPATTAFAQPKPGATIAGVKALIYDVFGTCVDWRNGVAREAERILKPLGYKLDWLAFADAWRALYQPMMETVRSGCASRVEAPARKIPSRALFQRQYRPDGRHRETQRVPWDAILGSEIARDFKPKAAVYLMSAAARNLRPEEVMMCAAHSGDLQSAAANGLRTAHIAHPGENGPGTGETTPRVPVDFAAAA